MTTSGDILRPADQPAATRSASPRRSVSARAVGLTLSVVIPVKDDSARLSVCLEALARQTLPMREVIVVDNASTDDSAEVARRAGARLLFEGRPGIAAASETGYDEARGDVIARIDADTVVSAEWAAEILAGFARRADVGAITGGAAFTDGPRWARLPAALLYLGTYFGFCALALGHAPVFGSNFAMRRSAWEDVRASVHGTESIHDDLDLSFHLGRLHRIRFSRRLRVGISMRPFWDGKGRLRVRRVLHTLALHWPEDLPWRRIVARRRATRR